MKLGKSMSLVGVFCAAVAGGMVADALVDTGPVVCLVDPTCRDLTQNEQKMLRPIFGNTLPYAEIKVFKRPPLLKLFADGHIGSVFHKNVYLTKDAGPQQDDYGLSADPVFGGDVIGDDIFVHEIAHIWQNQKVGHPFNLEEQDYYYEIKPDSVFSDFNFEQQAEIIRTYFVLRREIIRDTKQMDAFGTPEEERQLLDRTMSAKCSRMVPHQKILEKVLPFEPLTVCGPAAP